MIPVAHVAAGARWTGVQDITSLITAPNVVGLSRATISMTDTEVRVSFDRIRLSGAGTIFTLPVGWRMSTYATNTDSVPLINDAGTAFRGKLSIWDSILEVKGSFLPAESVSASIAGPRRRGEPWPTEPLGPLTPS